MQSQIWAPHSAWFLSSIHQLHLVPSLKWSIWLSNTPIVLLEPSRRTRGLHVNLITLYLTSTCWRTSRNSLPPSWTSQLKFGRSRLGFTLLNFDSDWRDSILWRSLGLFSLIIFLNQSCNWAFLLVCASVSGQTWPSIKEINNSKCLATMITCTEPPNITRSALSASASSCKWSCSSASCAPTW